MGAVLIANASAQTQGAASGTATFTGLFVTNVSASVTLTFTDSGLANPTIVSGGINVSAGTATALAITTQPSSTANAGVPLAVQPVVAVQDAYGNTVTSSSATVYATASAGNVSGPVSTNAVSGVAAFSGLYLTNLNNGSPVTLTFTNSSLTSATSIGITVNRAAFVKANNTTTLNLAGSWTSGGPPGVNDFGRWNSVATASATPVLLGAAQSWYGIQILNPTTAQVIGYDTNTLTLGAGGIDLSLATTNFTVNCGLSLNGGQTWTVTNGQTLAINSAVIGGTGPLTKTGAGTLTLPIADAAYSGATLVNQGTLALGLPAPALKWKADDLGSGSASTWTDELGGVVANSGNAAPTITSAAFNGHKAVSFSGSQNLWVAAASSPMSGAGDFSIVVVVKAHDGGHRRHALL